MHISCSLLFTLCITVASAKDNENNYSKKHQRKHQQSNHHTHHSQTSCRSSTAFSTDFRFSSVSAVNQLFTPFATDGTLRIDSKSGLIVDSTVFATAGVGVNYHTKYFAFTNQAFPVPDRRSDEELYVEAVVSAQTYGILTPDGKSLAPGMTKYASGITSARDDPRLACGSINLLDFQNGFVFNLLITNTTLYAVYERIPTNVTVVNTYAKAIGTRPGDPMVQQLVRISYSTKHNRVTWYIDGDAVWHVDHVGLPLPDRNLLVLNGDTYHPQIVHPAAFQAAFGTLAILDWLPVDNLNFDSAKDIALANLTTSVTRYTRYPDIAGNPVDDLKYAYTGPPQVDGQGAVLQVKSFKVGYSCSPCTSA